MTSNDKAMYEFAQLLDKVDAEVKMVKEAKKKDDDADKEKAMKQKKKEKEEAAAAKEKAKAKAKKLKHKKKAELFSEAVQTLVSLASELEEDGHTAAADLVDDALRIIVDDLSK